MIVTVTPNAALDITYELDRLVPGETHAVRRVRTRAGGKGVNVTSVLIAMGYASLAAGFVGGPPGQTILADLTDRGVPHLFTDVLGFSRRNVKVVAADGSRTLFNEPGPEVPPQAWAQLRSSIQPLLAGPATALVASGKMPVGSPDDALTGILSLAGEHDVPCVVDAARGALLGALPHRPAVVKPNREELVEVTEGGGLVSRARHLQRLGAHAVAITLGRRGVVLVPQEGPVLRAFVPASPERRGSGSGDALAAALSTGVGRLGWEELVRRAVAWRAASVRQPVPGLVSAADVAELEPLVVVDEVRGDLDLDGLPA